MAFRHMRPSCLLRIFGELCHKCRKLCNARFAKKQYFCTAKQN